VVTPSATSADICSATNFSVTLTYDVANTIGQWTAAADPGILGASPGAGSLLFQTLFNTNPNPANVVYTVTPNALGCTGTPVNITVVVEPIPTMSGLPPTVTVCDDGVLNVALSSTTTGAQFNWTATASSPGITGFNPTGIGNVINETLSNSDIFAGSLLYQVTPSFQRTVSSPTCQGNPGAMIVTVDAPVAGSFLNGNLEVCAGGTQFLIFSFSGSGPFDVQYSDGTSTIPLNNVGSVYPLQVTPTATTTYTITRVEDLYGCVATPNVPVTVFVNQTDASFNIIGPTASCTPFQAQFQYNQVAGTRYTWRWFDGNPDSVYTAGTTEPGKIIVHTFANPSPSGTLTYKVTLLTDVESVITPGLFLCPDSETKNVQVYPQIFVNIFPDKPTTICSGEDITFFNSSLGVTSHRWFYRVQGNVGQELDVKTTSIATFTFTNTTSSNPIIYEVVYQANNGNCPTETIETVTVYQGVTASFDEGTVPPFVGGNATVTYTNTSNPVNTGVFRYDWDFGLDSSPNVASGGGPFNVNYASPGPRDVILTATNILAEGNGLTCQSTYSETITILLPPLTAAFKAEPKAQCFPGEIRVTENTATGDIYEWRVVDDAGITAAVSNAPLPVFTIVNPGVYTVILKTTNSITGQVAFQNDAGYEIYEKPQSSFEARPTILYVPDTELATFNFSLGANFYAWDFGDGGTSDEFEPTYVYKVEGVYDISLIAGYDHGNGVQCTDTVKRQITAKQGGLTKVPNAFTPSPNGPTGGQSGSGTFNDVFLPITRGVEEFNMQIFDRWGTLIFESTNQNIGWDGYDKNGKLMPAGVYVFKLTLRLSDGQRTTQIGDVTLIR
jgi:gliding motility-associated-like protein